MKRNEGQAEQKGLKGGGRKERGRGKEEERRQDQHKTQLEQIEIDIVVCTPQYL